MITDHAYVGGEHGNSCQFEYDPDDDVWYEICGAQEMMHEVNRAHSSELVRVADVAEYPREAMPEAARKGPVVTLIDAPVDPLGTMAVIGGIYVGKVRRSKSEVSDTERREMLADMQATVLNGPLESIQFTFLVEGVSRAITHQMVRSRFAFFAQESLRFAVPEDWAQDVPLPPSAAQDPDGVMAEMYRRILNRNEDDYAALVAAGMPAEEARGVLVHDITTRLYWTVSLRTLLQEAGKRVCTQAQFPWRQIFGGVAKAFRDRESQAYVSLQEHGGPLDFEGDGWQYRAFADLIRPVCYQEGKCGFMAKFDRGCTIRNRVDANYEIGRPSDVWGSEHDAIEGNPVVSGVGPRSVVRTEQGQPVFIGAIEHREWAADPSAARVYVDPGKETVADVRWYCSAGAEVGLDGNHRGGQKCEHGGHHLAPPAEQNTIEIRCRCERLEGGHTVGVPGCMWEGGVS